MSSAYVNRTAIVQISNKINRRQPKIHNTSRLIAIIFQTLARLGLDTRRFQRTHFSARKNTASCHTDMTRLCSKQFPLKKSRLLPHYDALCLHSYLDTKVYPRVPYVRFTPTSTHKYTPGYPSRASYVGGALITSSFAGHSIAYHHRQSSFCTNSPWHSIKR